MKLDTSQTILLFLILFFFWICFTSNSKSDKRENDTMVDKWLLKNPNTANVMFS
jgi:hypothetical protein